ncbi:hypothetical protein BCR42DRAFT_406423 [Absidia repens]|uniref:Uncharacterized protein n=1 Tax=Absidia repens TaxID=90262 RepID=A0A1X2IUV9_9FUNG|nr:hypothetical protein BCR42DRAFT_406423 [Absidia repens]
MSTVQQAPTVEVPLSSSRDEQMNAAKQSAVQAADQMVDFDRVMYFIRSLREGKLPKNQQLKTILQQIRTNPGIDRRSNDLSKDGQALLADFRQLVQVLENCLDKKNGGELTQSLIYHLRHVDGESLKKQASPIKDAKPGVDKQQAKETVKSGFDNFKMIAKLIFVNDEFQNLANEIIDVLKDIFGETQERMIDSARDKAEQMKQDHPARVNKGDVKEKLDQRQESLQAAGDAGGGDIDMDQLKQEMSQQWQGTKEKYSQGMQRMKESTGKEAQRQFYATKEGIQQRLTKEKQRELIDRLKLVMVQVQKNSEYQQAMDSLQRALSHWSNEASDIHEQVGDVANRTARQMKSDTNLSKAGSEAKTIAEDWANGQSLDPLIQTVKQLFSDIKNDKQFDDYIQKLWNYTQRLVKEPGYVTDEQSTTDGQQLIELGRSADFDTYRGCLSEMGDHAKTFCQALAQDPTAMEIKQVLKKIHQDLWLDVDGNPSFKPHLLMDIGISLLPAIMDKISTMPVPHIEYHDDKFDVAVENMVLTGSSILPGEVDVKMYNHMRYSSKAKSNNQQTVYIHLSNIQVQMQDVVFYYKKMGFPSISDRGVADVNTYGKGMAMTLGLTSDSNNNLNTYTVETCHCLVDKLNFRITDSRHNLLYKTVHPMVTTIVKHQLGRIIAAKVREGLMKGDVWLTGQLKQYGVPISSETGSANNVTMSTDSRPMKNNLKQKRPGLFASLITIINNRMKTKKRKDSLNQQLDNEKMAKDQQQLELGQQKNATTSGNQPSNSADGNIDVTGSQTGTSGTAMGVGGAAAGAATGMAAGTGITSAASQQQAGSDKMTDTGGDQQQFGRQDNTATTTGNKQTSGNGSPMGQETEASPVPLAERTNPTDEAIDTDPSHGIGGVGGTSASKDTSVYGTPVGQNPSPRAIGQEPGPTASNQQQQRQQQQQLSGGGMSSKTNPKSALDNLITMDQQHHRDNVTLGQHADRDNAMLGQHTI